MDADLARRYGPGARILFRRGPALPALLAAAAALGAGAVYYNRRCGMCRPSHPGPNHP